MWMALAAATWLQPTDWRLSQCQPQGCRQLLIGEGAGPLMCCTRMHSSWPWRTNQDVQHSAKSSNRTQSSGSSCLSARTLLLSVGFGMASGDATRKARRLRRVIGIGYGPSIWASARWNGLQHPEPVLQIARSLTWRQNRSCVRRGAAGARRSV